VSRRVSFVFGGGGVIPVFIFRFGYESPLERDSNNRYGTDFESSQYEVIESPDDEAALTCGCEVAEQFVRKACGEWWRAGSFAHRIEPLSACPWAVGRQVVTIGQLPEFSRWEWRRRRTRHST
jgi:hypothetical protein